MSIPQQAPIPPIKEQLTVPQITESVAAPPLDVVVQVRPWVRFWARFIDTSLLGCVISFLLIIAMSFLRELITTQSQLYWAMGFIVFIALFLWVFVEAFLISKFGTTPGKWLLRIQLAHVSGEPITILQAAKRYLLIWSRGLGLGIPILSFIAPIIAYAKVKRNGATSWDREGGFTVSHKNIGIPRSLVVIICIFGSIFLVISTRVATALVRTDIDRFIDSIIEHTYSPASSTTTNVQKKDNDNIDKNTSSTQLKTSTTNPGDVEPDWLNQSNEFWEKNDWPGALKHALRWTQAQPAVVDAWNTLGFAYHKTKQYAKAIEAYQQAVRIKPEFVEAWNNLGITYKDSNQLVKAIDAYQQATRIDPKHAVAWNNLGDAYERSNLTDKAIDAYQQATRIAPKEAIVWNNLANAYDTSKQYAKAIEAIEQTTRIDPEDKNSWSHLGVAYGKSNQSVKAINAFQQAVRIDPKDAVVWKALGDQYTKTKQTDKAIEAFQQAVRIDPKDGNAWLYLGFAYQESEHEPQAMEAFEKAARINIEVYQQATHINSEDGKAWYSLGGAYMGQGQHFNPYKAIEAYQQVIRINPKDAEAWYGLGFAYNFTDPSQVMEVHKRLKTLDAAKADKFYNEIVVAITQQIK